jgi:energy-coupling factor transporter ATP-binding protein EcfA2
MIRIRNLNIDYMGAPGLQDINLHIPAGQCLLITGPSGWCESEEEYV